MVYVAGRVRQRTTFKKYFKCCCDWLKRVNGSVVCQCAAKELATPIHIIH
jgi:hypothetical protein